MSERAYSIVDVFSSTPLEGNALAVVTDASGLSTAHMQAVAREFNLSETSFIERRPAAVERAEGVRVRIFTTQEELPFAGHPTLGTAAVLAAEAPETMVDGVVTLALNVGPVPVRMDPPGSTARYGEMTQRDPEFGSALDAATVAQLIGLSVDDLDPAVPPQIVSTGTAFGIVVLRSSQPLAHLHVDQQKAASWLRAQGARWFYVLGPTGGADGPSWRARMQFYGGEDPATGSAAGCAISLLVNRGTVADGEKIHLRQGVEMGRPSDLFLSAEGNSARVRNVRVGGSTVPVAKGRIFLP